MVKRELEGMTFGKLTVLEMDKVRSKKRHRDYWTCECECGKITSVAGYALVHYKTKSCGCGRRLPEKLALLNAQKSRNTTLTDEELREAMSRPVDKSLWEHPHGDDWMLEPIKI